MKKRIVLVDDDLAVQDAICTIMQRSGHEVISFGDGAPLLRGEFEVPDLFILDKQLPGVSGLDLCKYLKALERTQHVPVLILSASPQIAVLARQVCADGFMEKPFKMQELRAMAEQLVS